MTVSVDQDDMLTKLITELGSKVYFIIISSENGVVKKAYINENEFNKASISLNVSQLYELAEDITTEIGIHNPDFNIIHSDNYYILSVKILEKIIILLTQDQVELGKIFDIINKSVKS
jgi:predicted regulator of Ras-like GTPase activity (Roadblock/LC7/MglB family)